MSAKDKGKEHKRQWSLSSEVDTILLPEAPASPPSVPIFPSKKRFSRTNLFSPNSTSPLSQEPRGILIESPNAPVVTGSVKRAGSPLGNVKNSLPKSIPQSSTSIHFKNTPTKFVYNNNSPLGQYGSIQSARQMALGQSPGSQGQNPLFAEPEVLTEEQVAHILSEHLVSNEEGGISQVPVSESFGSVSHSLLGGETTRGIYQWKEKRESISISRKRRNSAPDLKLNQGEEHEPIRASELREPGVFRRFFVASKAQKEGKEHNIVTRNFIDFLLLYGYYGGDIYPSDDEGEEEILGAQDVESLTENTPLLTVKTRSSNASLSVHGTSTKKAFFMLIKAFVGTGVLFLPQAFKNGGMGFSIGLMLILGYLTLHCMNLLVETSRAMGGLSFGDLGERLFGYKVKQLVLASIAVSQMGFCCAYYIFVATNLKYLVNILTDYRYDLPEWVYIVVQIAIYIPLSWVRRIKHFSLTSLIADVFILLGLSYILFYDLFRISTHGVAKDIVWINLQSFPLFVGTAMFAFEGICLILPIADSMKEPEKFSKVIMWCMMTIGVVFVTIGATGYLALGNQVGTIIFLDLPQGPVPNGLQFFYAIAIILSFPLCVYPAVRITEQGLFGLKDGKASHLVKWQKNLYRALLVSFLGGVAWAGADSLDKVVSLVGCFACIPLSFIYPAIFHYQITTSKVSKLTDMLLIIFGTLATVYTTYITLQQWATKATSQPAVDPSIHVYS